MCCIIHSPDRKHRPSLSTLRLIDARNPHGTGIAWLEAGGRVSYIKGLSPESIAENLDVLRGPVVIHFRYATVGGKREQLCHPFPVTQTAWPKSYGSAKQVLFHNGHWSDWNAFATEHRLDLEGPVSDSRVIAIGAWMGGESFLNTLIKEGAGRFVLFSHEGVKLFGNWERKDGCDYSNLLWCPRAPAKKAPRKSSDDAPAWWDDWRPTQLDLPEPRRRQASDLGDAAVCFGD